MKKKLFLVLIALVVLLIGAVVFITIKANDVVARYKPQIEEGLSSALGAKVRLGELNVSVIPHLRIGVESMSLSNEKGEQLPVSLSALKADAALWPLLSKKLELTTIELVRPALTLQKTAAGISIPGLLLGSTTPPATAPSASPSTPTTPQPSSATANLAVEIKQITIRDGEITLDDRVAGRKTTVKAVQFESAIEVNGPEIKIPQAALRFSLQGPQIVSLAATAVSFNQHLQKLSLGSTTLTTDAGTIAAQGELETKSATGLLDLSSKAVSLQKLAPLLAALTGSAHTLPVNGDLGFKLVVKNPTATTPQLTGALTLTGVSMSTPTATTISDLSGSITLNGTTSDLTARGDGVKLTYQKAPLVVTFDSRITPGSFTLRSLAVKGFSGTVNATANLSLTTPKPYSADVSAATLSIEELLKTFKTELQQYATGTLTTFKTQAKGELAGTLAASGNLAVKNGVLKGTNLPNVILAKFDSIPFLEGAVRQFVPREFERYLTSPNTEVKELTATFAMQSGSVTIPAFSLVSDIFSLDGNGSIAPDGTLSMNTTFFFTKDFSQALTLRNKNMKNILATDGRLIIPLAIRGKAPSLVAYPDVTKIIETGAAKALQEKALGAVEKALNGKGKNGALGKSLGKALGF